jgi:hypothetical protein
MYNIIKGGHMKTNLVFVGNIRRCVGFTNRPTRPEPLYTPRLIPSLPFKEDMYIDVESEPYKEDAILIKTNNYGYVDVDTLNLPLLIYISTLSQKDPLDPTHKFKKAVMMTFPCKEGALFVERESTKPYKEIFPEVEKEISIGRLKRRKMS